MGGSQLSSDALHHEWDQEDQCKVESTPDNQEEMGRRRGGRTDYGLLHHLVLIVVSDTTQNDERWTMLQMKKNTTAGLNDDANGSGRMWRPIGEDVAAN